MERKLHHKKEQHKAMTYSEGVYVYVYVCACACVWKLKVENWKLKSRDCVWGVEFECLKRWWGQADISVYIRKKEKVNREGLGSEFLVSKNREPFFMWFVERKRKGPDN